MYIYTSYTFELVKIILFKISFNNTVIKQSTLIEYNL